MILQFIASGNEIRDPSDDHIEGAIVALPLRDAQDGFTGVAVVVAADESNWLGINSTSTVGKYQIVSAIRGKRFQTKERVSLKEAVLMAQSYAKKLHATKEYEWEPYDIGEELKELL